MTLEQFQRNFRNEGDCQDFLFKSRWPDGFCCTRCGFSSYYYIPSRNLFQCIECKTQISLTTGTLLHRTKLPLMYWFLVIYCVTSGQRCTALWITTILKINYRSALRMLRTVRMAMRYHNGLHLLSNFSKRVENDMKEKIEKIENIEKIEKVKKMGRVGKQEVIERAQEIMVEETKQFTRSNYRYVSPRYFQGYVEEYYFRKLYLERTNKLDRDKDLEKPMNPRGAGSRSFFKILNLFSLMVPPIEFRGVI